jgi:hypothetical protein
VSDVETTTVDAVVYEIVFAEVNMNDSDRNTTNAESKRLGLIQRLLAPPPLWDWMVRSFMELEEQEHDEKNGFVVFSNNDVIRSTVRALENMKKLSVLSRPQVTTVIGAEAIVTMGTDTITLLPFRQDGKVVTIVDVKRTEIHDGKEKTHRWSMAHALLDNQMAHALLDNPSSLVSGGRLGDKNVVLVIKAWEVQETVPAKTKVAHDSARATRR